MAHPAVAEAMAFPVPHPTLGESVAAAVVLREGARATVQEIRLFASGRLAPFKLPQPIVIVAAIPTGRSGKPQRIGLAERLGLTESQRRDGGQDERVAPHARRGEARRDPGRRAGPRAVGIHDNFFQLGGHSLTATMAAARIAEEFQVDLPVQALFERPTVAELADAVAMLVPGQGPPDDPSQAQRRSLPALLRAAAALVPRPGRTRQSRLQHAGRPASHGPLGPRGPRREPGRDPPPARGAAHDLHRGRRAAGAGHRSRNARCGCRSSTSRGSRRPNGSGRRGGWRPSRPASPFNLARGPLFRAVLARLDPSEHVLILTMHHIVSDGWSNTVLFAELATLYRAFAAGQALAAAGAADPVRRLRRLAAALGGSSAEPGSTARLLERAAPRRPARPRSRARSTPARPPDLAGRETRAADTRLSRRAPRRGRRTRRRHALHDGAGGLPGAALALHPAGEVHRRNADREPDAHRDGEADRLLREHAGPAGRSVGRSVVPDPARTRASDGPRRVRAPGPAVREARGGAAAGATSRSRAALPGDVRVPELHRAARRVRDGTDRPAPAARQRDREVRPDAVPVSDRTGAGIGVAVQHRSLRARDDRAHGRPLPHSARWHRGTPRSAPLPTAPRERRRAPAAARGGLRHRRPRCRSALPGAVRSPGGAHARRGRRAVRRRARDLSRPERACQPAGASTPAARGQGRRRWSPCASRVP